MPKEFEITYIYKSGLSREVPKFRTTNKNHEPFTFEEAKAFYKKMLKYQKTLPNIYKNVDCNFKELLEDLD